MRYIKKKSSLNMEINCHILDHMMWSVFMVFMLQWCGSWKKIPKRNLQLQDLVADQNNCPIRCWHKSYLYFQNLYSLPVLLILSPSLVHSLTILCNLKVVPFNQLFYQKTYPSKRWDSEFLNMCYTWCPLQHQSKYGHFTSNDRFNLEAFWYIISLEVTISIA